MSEESEGWMKPSDVMKNRRKRKILVRSRSMDFQKILPNRVMSPEVQTSKPGGSVKRRNPFGCSDLPAKRSLEQESETKTKLSGSILFDGLNTTKNGKSVDKETPEVLPDVTSSTESRSADVVPQCTPQLLSKVMPQPEPMEETSPPPTTHPRCPTDWCLRTRLRFVSPSPFTWCANLKGSEETAGLNAFVRGAEQCQDLTSDSCEAKSSLQRHTMYWVHPHIPWLRLFPRIRSDSKVGTAGVVTQSEEVQKSLMADWSSSFTSVFHQLRCSFCPYFYLCTHQFSVLFRAASVGGHDQPHAILTPTSRGFREALGNEGITFTMPLAPKGLDPQAEDELEGCSDNQASDATDIAAGSEIVEEGADQREWLESIGLNASKFRALDPIKIKLQKEGYRIIDHRPESMLLVQGADCQALFNYLLNCRSCVAVTGPQAGLPPTILAPTPFQGATLQSLKTKCSSVRQAGGTAAYSIEITGPVLPHVLHNLTDLFSHTQKEFTCVGSVHEPTTPFNAGSSISEDPKSSPDRMNFSEDQVPLPEVPESLQNSGLPPVHLQNIVRCHGLGKKALRELSYKEGYSWVL